MKNDKKNVSDELKDVDIYQKLWKDVKWKCKSYFKSVKIKLFNLIYQKIYKSTNGNLFKHYIYWWRHQKFSNLFLIGWHRYVLLGFIEIFFNQFRGIEQYLIEQKQVTTNPNGIDPNTPVGLAVGMKYKRTRITGQCQK